MHAPIGKISFDSDKLTANLNALIEMLNRMRPASAKGVYMRNVVLSSTMGPGIRLDASSLREPEE